MTDDKDIGGEDVTISVDIEGEYGKVMSKLRSDEEETDYLADLVDDVEQLLKTVEQIDGGTRSAIAQALPDDSSMAGDPDAVVTMLQVLERYDLVSLEGNTWMPGPRLGEN